MRRGPAQFFHQCPACKSMHPLPDSWHFNGDLDRPTFTPSFRQHLSQGDCHYIITDGVIQFCGDSFHELRGQSVPMVELPDDLKDFT